MVYLGINLHVPMLKLWAIGIAWWGHLESWHRHLPLGDIKQDYKKKRFIWNQYNLLFLVLWSVTWDIMRRVTRVHQCTV